MAVFKEKPGKARENEFWSEWKIAGIVARQTFRNRAVVLVPNCGWTGHECDLLVVEQGLRIIDVEIKISRSDLKADAKKDKWWHQQFGRREEWRDNEGRIKSKMTYDKTPRQFPRRVWKHYFCLPLSIWDDSLIEFLPSPASGVIGLSDRGDATVIRRAKTNPDAYRCTENDVLNIARMANVRLWVLRRNCDRLQKELIEAKSA